jgi:hypothetical protein
MLTRFPAVDHRGNGLLMYLDPYVSTKTSDRA